MGKHTLLVVLTFFLSSVVSFEMWHLTDVHLDPLYKTHSDPLQLCRGGKGNSGKYGDYSCDANNALMETLVSFMKANTDINGKVILYTGDIVSRALPNYNQDTVKNAVENITTFLRKFPDYFVVPVLGNHDVFPANQMAINSQWMFNYAADLWVPFLTKDALESFKHGGYYYMQFPTKLGIKKQLNVVVLNTVLYHNYNKQTMDGTDPLGQFEWYRNTMDGFRKTGQRALVAMHICPGVAERFNYSDQLYPQYNDRLVDLLSEYSDITSGIICGHLHTDTFRIVGSGNKKILALIGPSVDTWLGTSPSIRKVDMGDGTGFMASFKNYNFLLRPKGKKKGEKGKEVKTDKYNKWKFNYESSAEYGVNSLSPSEFEVLFARMEKDEKLFEKYHKHFRGDTPGFECNGNCKANCLCAVRYPKQNDFANCVVWN
uniref:Sphingomyelin phosphodiesterase, putative n=1 Tax=Entamoeba invadens TaxID=33085 RepID=S0B8N0_ENTIV|nr:sphingomyelin phosphodiesterase, putative [Entamoeba invadens]